jgi:hypothetical protein
MNVLANVITPKILHWWALTNLKRLRERIVKLRQQRFKYSALFHASVRQESYIKAVRWALYATSGFMLFAFAFVLIAFTWFEELVLNITRATDAIDIVTESRFFYKGLCSLTIAAAIAIQVLIIRALFFVNRASKIRMGSRLVDVEMELKALEDNWKPMNEKAFLRARQAGIVPPDTSDKQTGTPPKPHD